MPTNLNIEQAVSPAMLGGAASLVRNAGAASPAEPVAYGLSMRFSVAVDGLSLGDWSTCKGLRVDFKTTGMTQGGDYQHVTYLPERVEYSKVTLERAMTARESPAVWEWLHGIQEVWMKPTLTGRGAVLKNVPITLRDAKNQDVMRWILADAMPISWSCSPFDTSTSSIVIETLEFQHGGFL